MLQVKWRNVGLLRLAIVGFWMLVATVGHHHPVLAQEAFLKKGTLAINPKDGKTLFLYVPALTLLYELGETKTIGSKSFKREAEYQLATTQDGIKVLVKKDEIENDVETLSKYDFLVNRRMPFCDSELACEEIWTKFNSISDEGDNWQAIWPSVAGSLLSSNNSGVWNVTLQLALGNRIGYIPARKGGQSLEDVGYISVLNRTYPLYRFHEKELENLTSPCGEEETKAERQSVQKEIQTLVSASAGLSVDTDSAGRSVVLKFAKSVLDFLGFSAVLGADMVVSAGTGKEFLHDKSKRFTYGNHDEKWTVKWVEIDRKLDLTSDRYRKYRNLMIRKVYKCQGNQPTEMTFASFLLTEPTLGASGEVTDSPPIFVSSESIENLRIENAINDMALVSVNTQGSHGVLVDHFVREHDVPKGIANFFIKEINIAKPRK